MGFGLFFRCRPKRRFCHRRKSRWGSYGQGSSWNQNQYQDEGSYQGW
jgi:hypothetical protein